MNYLCYDWATGYCINEPGTPRTDAAAAAAHMIRVVKVFIAYGINLSGLVPGT